MSCGIGREGILLTLQLVGQKVAVEAQPSVLTTAVRQAPSPTAARQLGIRASEPVTLCEVTSRIGKRTLHALVLTSGKEQEHENSDAEPHTDQQGVR